MSQDSVDGAAPAAPTAAAAPSYDPTRMYRVELNSAVECPPGSGKLLLPGRNRRNTVRGDLVAGLGSALTSAKPI